MKTKFVIKTKKKRIPRVATKLKCQEGFRAESSRD